MKFGWLSRLRGAEQRLALTLDLLEQNEHRLTFRLTLENRSHVKLLLPYPEIHNLHFTNQATGLRSQWYCSCLVSATWVGTSILPGETWPIEYRVRPCGIDAPDEDRWDDYERWCVELPAANYVVSFEFEVSRDYFCGDSHYTYANLVREAQKAGAQVWIGHVRSNEVDVSQA